MNRHTSQLEILSVGGEEQLLLATFEYDLRSQSRTRGRVSLDDFAYVLNVATRTER